MVHIKKKILKREISTEKETERQSSDRTVRRQPVESQGERLQEESLRVWDRQKRQAFWPVKQPAVLTGHYLGVAQSCPTLCDPTGCSLPSSSAHGLLQGKKTGAGCPALLQGIFLTQGSNPWLLQRVHLRQILYPLSHRESPYIYTYCMYIVHIYYICI